MVNFAEEIGKPLILSTIFTVVGIILFALSLLVIIKVSPFSVRKEIEDDQNTSLGIIIGAVIIGISIILAATLVDFNVNVHPQAPAATTTAPGD
jgi:uncharacterized membrane protein YjfL (UPF0719 family)